MNKISMNQVIRANNFIWSRMYYDLLMDRPRYQLTYFSKADQDYYNCVHAVGRLSKSDFKDIELFFKKRHLPFCFYLDNLHQKSLIAQLIKQGYHEVVDQQEHWWTIILSDNMLTPLTSAHFLKLDSNNVAIKQVDPLCEQDFKDFLWVDQKANALTNSIIMALSKNLKKHLVANDGEKIYLFLGKIGNQPAVVSSIGFYQDMAFLAEGGTLNQYRAKGLYSHMIRHLLLFAAKQGIKKVFINCAYGAFSNAVAKKLGFSFVFTRQLYKKENIEISF